MFDKRFVGVFLFFSQTRVDSINYVKYNYTFYCNMKPLSMIKSFTYHLFLTLTHTHKKHPHELTCSSLLFFLEFFLFAYFDLNFSSTFFSIARYKFENESRFRYSTHIHIHYSLVCFQHMYYTHMSFAITCKSTNDRDKKALNRNACAHINDMTIAVHPLNFNFQGYNRSISFILSVLHIRSYQNYNFSSSSFFSFVFYSYERD